MSEAREDGLPEPTTLDERRSAVTIALAIPTTASWAPGRDESLALLLGDLGAATNEYPPASQGGADILVHDNRSTRHEWSAVCWAWGVSRETCSHFMLLQDDVRVAPNFWPALRAMLLALPGEVICLQSVHQAAPALCSEDVRWYTTIDGMLGPAYVLPRAVLAEFMAWRAERLTGRPDEFPEGEDTLLGLFCMVTRRRIWSPIPTIVDHPGEVASTFGHNARARQRPLVRWDMAQYFGNAWTAEDLEAPGFWEGRFKRLEMKAPDLERSLGWKKAYNLKPEPPRHLGRFYENGIVPDLARQWVKGYGVQDLVRDRADDGKAQLRRLSYALRGKGKLPDKRLLILTPVKGDTSPQYAVSLLAYQSLGECDVRNGFELLDAWAWSDDLVRVRSRMVYRARETDATHVLWVDADNEVTAVAVRGMLAAGKDLVACPYPRRDARDGIDFARVVKAAEAGAIPQGIPPEAFAYNYSIGLLPGQPLDPDETGCAKVDWFSLGCSLMTLEALERMTVYYRDLEAKVTVDLERINDAKSEAELTELAEDLIVEVQSWRSGHLGLNVVDRDPFTKQDAPMTALFQLLPRASEETGVKRLWGEDQSFCKRAGDIGLDRWVYLGPGSPVSHMGQHCYRGRIEAFGFSRGGAP